MLDVTTYILARGYTNGAIAQQSESGAANLKEVELETISGQISGEDLNSLLDSNSSIIKLAGKIYRLARIEGDNYKYLNSSTNGDGQVINMTELDINKNTGEFETKQIIFASSSVQYLEDALNEHKNDNTVHITATERNNWNNKVSAKAELISGEQDYILKLKH